MKTDETIASARRTLDDVPDRFKKRRVSFDLYNHLIYMTFYV
jgi:hypothetical protein